MPAQQRVGIIAKHLASVKESPVDHQQELNISLRGDGIEVLGTVNSHYAHIVSPAALHFVAGLHRKFERTRQSLMAKRDQRQQQITSGMLPDFLNETAWIREGSWKCAPLPADLLDRRVEITGPTSRKMVINALNSGASCFMADFEDATSPTWDNLIEGQENLRDAVNGTISFKGDDGKFYTLNKNHAVLLVRPRGWHLLEKHVQVDGAPVSASLFDFGLYFYHNARHLIQNGSGPYFYLPKMESHLEARLWNDVFNHSQDALNIPRGTIKATVLIETILGSFEMDEILYELRDQS
eukprot:TRINITY_DN7540_c0_g1_i1.p1 TRINITY_DN7540_c0_g1~~TRINITY_DN7540_c0_g1_i1.p1  ORF type:complete len:296 (+),score=72.40 TRINITY_DN7540_c0_g1_i1:102-989(+)